MKSQLQIMLYSFLGFAGLEQAPLSERNCASAFGSVAGRSCERTVPDRRAAKGDRVSRALVPMPMSVKW